MRQVVAGPGEAGPVAVSRGTARRVRAGRNNTRQGLFLKTKL